MTAKIFLNNRYWFSLFLQVLCFFVSIKNINAESVGFKIRTIVLDAGHGGKDSGAVGRFSKEKDIALKTTLELGALIKKKLPDIKIIYTRSRDLFIPVFERTKIARKHADIFVSIHCNACTAKSAYGIETYVMSIEQLTSTSAAAKRENAVVLLENKFRENYTSFNAKSSDSHIIFALQNNSSHTNSLKLAQKIQKEMQKKGLRNRGVYQDRFVLFYRTIVPSILVEIGYITNEKEEKYMNSAEGRSTIVNAIFTAISEYKKEVEKKA